MLILELCRCDKEQTSRKSGEVFCAPPQSQRHCRGGDVQGCQNWQKDCEERLEAHDHEAHICRSRLYKAAREVRALHPAYGIGKLEQSC